MKKSKLFAPFLMLLAGAVASIMMYHFKYTMKQMLPILLTVLLIFYLAGLFIQKQIVSFVKQIKEEEEREGEVIEKDSPVEGGEKAVNETVSEENMENGTEDKR